MRVLLLKVPYCPHPEAEINPDPRVRNSFRPMPSLALAALGAWVRARHEVQAVDLNLAAPGAGSGDLPKHLLAEMERVISDGRYDVLGLSVMFAYNIRWARSAIKMSLRYHPDAKVIVGGGLPTLFPYELGVGTVVRGEGEQQLERLLAGGSGGERLSDLGVLPPPAWDLLNVEAFWGHGAERILPIEASRGCPYNCSYCTVTGTWGPRVRYKDVAQVMREIARNVDVHGAKALHFVDDNLAFDGKWFKRFLSAFISSGIKVKLDASNFAAVHLDEEGADLMVRAGFDRVCVAVESGSPVILKKIRKRIDLGSIKDKVRMLQRAGLWVHLCWMVGFPGETKAEIAQTLELVKELRAESNQILVVVPYPGTDLYAEAQRAGMLVDDVPLDKLDCRQAELLVGQEWDYEWLRDAVYDVNIEVNFMDNVGITRTDGRFLRFLDDLLLRLPEHLVARLLAGWLHGDGPERDAHWTYLREAMGTLAAKPFGKYMVDGHPAVGSFERWAKA